MNSIDQDEADEHEEIAKTCTIITYDLLQKTKERYCYIRVIIIIIVSDVLRKVPLWGDSHPERTDV